MELRSGRIVTKCGLCKEYYANPQWNFKCSSCYGTILKSSYPWRNEEFRNDVNEWAEEKIQTSNISGGFRTFKQLIRQAYNGIYSKELRVAVCKELINKIQQNYKEHGYEFYISAKDGEELLRRTGQEAPEKFHIICPLVLDWWNMKKYNYNGSEMCYYGHFGDEMTFCEKIKSIPPPPPNKCMI